MDGTAAEQAYPDGQSGGRAEASVLADRIAAMVLGHKPGWLLQLSQLARRYDASLSDVEDAVGELVRRGVLRRMADGRLCRASPADWLIKLDEMAALGTCIDPMGASVTCMSTQTSTRPVRGDIGLILSLAPGCQTTVVKRLWTADGLRAATTTTYSRTALVTGESHVAEYPVDRDLNAPPPAAEFRDEPAIPAAVQVEIQPPQPAIARSLQLPVGMPAVAVAVRFDDHGTGRPVALTTAFLRCDLFRIIIETAADRAPARLPSAAGIAAHDMQEWEQSLGGAGLHRTRAIAQRWARGRQDDQSADSERSEDGGQNIGQGRL